jgi:D-alanyl-D-alanine carboxypeptidase
MKYLTTLMTALVTTLPLLLTSCGGDKLTTEQRLDALVADIMTKEAPPGMILGVWTPTMSYLKAVGVADIPSGAPMTTDMNYRIGSQSKMYISTVILQMVDEGKIALDDKVAKYLTGVTDGEKITIFQLITNTSGIPSYSEDAAWMKALFANPTRVWAPWELVGVSNKLKHPFDPGKGWHYSNTNFVILGLIAEAIDKIPVDEILYQRLSKPLGLRVTRLPLDTALPPPSPHGYYENGEIGAPRLIDFTAQSPSWGWTAGGMIGNAAESKTWIEAAVGGGLLSDAMQAKRMSTWVDTQTGVPGAASGYGMGIGNRDGVIGHTGSLPGWTSGAYRIVDRDATLVFFFNMQSEVSDPAARLLDEATTIIRSAP